MERNVNKGLTLLLLHLSAVALAMTPTGAVEGLFSISSTKQVYFSQGNLIHEDNTWSFAEHQYDKGSFFGWGTSGYGNPDTISGGKGFHFASIGGTSRNANFDWGVYNAISNGGNTPGLWRTLTSEEWTYLWNNHNHEWTTISGQPGLKVMADDGTNFLFLPAAGQIDVEATDISNANSGYYWTSTSVGDQPPSAEAYKLTETNPEFELEGNANRKLKMSVRLVYDTQAWLNVSDRENNSTELTKYKPQQGKMGLPMNVHVERTLTPGMSNTLTLPFDIATEEMEAIFGEGYRLLQLDTENPCSIDVEAQTFAVNLVEATSIAAGVPYLITPTQAVNNMHFYDRVIQRATNDECIAGSESDLVQFCGLLDSTHLEADNKNYLFLYPNNELDWSADGDDNEMYSLCAYFKVNALSPTDAPLCTFAPCMVITSPATHNPQSTIHTPPSTIRKILRDGQLFIERDGKTFNAQGVQVR